MNESYSNGSLLYPMYQLCSSLLSSLLPLAAIIISLMYAMNQKKRLNANVRSDQSQN